MTSKCQNCSSAISTEQKPKEMDTYDYRNYAKGLRDCVLRQLLERAYQQADGDDELLHIAPSIEDLRALLFDNSPGRNFDECHKVFGGEKAMGNHTWAEDPDLDTCKEIFPNGVPQFFQDMVVRSGDDNDLWYADPEDDSEIYYIKSFRIRPEDRYPLEMVIDFEKQYFVECCVDGEQYLAKECYTDGDVYIHEDNFANFYRVKN